MRYQKMQTVLREYNWDDGFGLPRRLLDEPGCDLALALEIFYLADGYALLSGIGAGSSRAEWKEFVTRLYDEIQRGKYPRTNAKFEIPLNRVLRYKLKKQGVPEVFLTDLPGKDTPQ